jgi:prepilin-type N-terminal cleavage/methylation domain-containing protein
MKGFTLIELLVVVLIIGILASIALPQYELVVEKARASEAMVNVRAILDAMQRHDQEFPGEEVTNCSEIADVQLKGGSWGAACAVSANPGSTACPEEGASFFSTKNFCYNINNAVSESSNNVTVSRMDGNTTLYTISYTKPTDGATPQATQGTGCTGDFAQVCKLFTSL